ncbi:MAG: DUF2845 domain-containing protein [Woeseia sp.]
MRKALALPLLACGALLASDPAHALRCGSKLILEGMLEPEVRAYCGKPTVVRELGYVIRSWHPLSQRMPLGALLFRSASGDYYQEVSVTEYIYNFGPRKFMRKLRFEGGILTDKETLGRGYPEDR